MIQRLWLMAAVTCTIWIFQVTAFPQTSETVSVEDVRRPVYRGNHRYKFFSNLGIKERVEEKTFKLFFNASNNVRTISNREKLFKNEPLRRKFMNNNHESLLKEIDKNNITWRNEHKKMFNASEDGVIWSQVQLTTGSNESKIVENFVENFLYDLGKDEDNYEKIMLPSTETSRHKQIYQASSQSSWIERPGVILVEDVHPSKLPKPPFYNEVPLYPQPTKPSVNYDYKPPVSKPSNTYGILESLTTKPPHHHNYPKPGVSKPAYPRPDIDTSTKPVDVMYFNPKPVSMKPTFDIVGSGVSTQQPISVTVTNVLTHFTPVYTKPPPEPPPRPPPPTIVVIEPPPDNYIDCGNIQVVNSATFKNCPDVTVVLNNNQNFSALSPASEANGQAAAVIPVSSVSPANGIVPIVSPPSVATPKPPITITVCDTDDEEYDYEDDEVANDVIVSSTTTTTPKPFKPSSSTSLFSYLQTLITSLPFIGPISVSLWIIFLGPISFLLLGAMGVASFIFPWLAPRLVFGRSTSGVYIEKPIIPQAAYQFLKNIKVGTFETKNW